jgi:hypothetical protein
MSTSSSDVLSVHSLHLCVGLTYHPHRHHSPPKLFYIFIYLFLGWVVEARVLVGEESNSPESGRTPELWVGARDGGWGGDDARYCVFVVLRFEIFMFKC